MTPLTRAEFGALPKLNVYVDETGDRGWSDKSSPFFAMTALLVPSEDDWTVRYAAGGLRSIVHASRPDTTTPLHWVDHFKAKRPERRLRAARCLASMPSAKVIHVIVPKDTARGLARGLADGVRFYNYTTRLLLERVAHAAKGWDGGPRLAIVRLGAVHGMDHEDTAAYLTWVRDGRCQTFDVPWQYIKWPPKWYGTEWDGIQLADIHAGLLNVALTGDKNDEECAANLLLCKHQLYRAPAGTLLGYGVKVIGDVRFVRDRAWWPKWSVG
ncbi:DUF3800 domain-containing protein [Streptomyces europaeiscabiei]|uniref:DUF3800 domain-containing protein n=1 Tax=Streptomyces europaeiscabiei TaxID=146819 RepID=UPI0029A9BA98|nr:DUF3800 domain-containing protein [Streptomyces europaeiscabiei]MDX3634353.1 DUF3800 domain-containing protein [Streptomyces europaeiscabiei]MDX3651799.1 DUF3800 domain-containing protein [Streptomyces europaeiscabiei]